jgi:type I restriction enzyme, S subunit
MVVEQATETAEFKQTEVGLIPIDWAEEELGNLTSKIGSGITPTGGERVYKSAGRPFLRSQNVGWGVLLMDDIAYIDEETHKTFSSTEIKLDDVFLNITGASIGRSAIASNRVIHGNVNQHVCIIRSLQEKLNFCYLNAVLLSKIGQNQIDSFQSGGNRQGLNFAQIRSFKIPLPPTLDEQRAIATALSDVDALITGLDALIAKKRAIKQGTMQQLLTGKKRLPGFKGEWETKTLGECLLEKPKYGINAAAVDFNDNLPKYIRITDITEDGKFSPDKPVSVNHFLSDNYYLEDGDLVFARTGASVGKSYQYKVDDGRLVYAGFLIKVKPDSSKLNITFLKNYTETGIYKNWVSLMSMRSGQPGINGNEYASLPISLPKSIEEQQAIAKILSDMDTEITALAQKRDKYKTVKQGMMQQLLTGKIRLV